MEDAVMVIAKEVFFWLAIAVFYGAFGYQCTKISLEVKNSWFSGDSDELKNHAATRFLFYPLCFCFSLLSLQEGKGVHDVKIIFENRKIHLIFYVFFWSFRLIIWPMIILISAILVNISNIALHYFYGGVSIILLIISDLINPLFENKEDCVK